MNRYAIAILKEEYESLMRERNRICDVINGMDGRAVIDNQLALRKLDEIRGELLYCIRILSNHKVSDIKKK